MPSLCHQPPHPATSYHHPLLVIAKPHSLTLARPYPRALSTSTLTSFSVLHFVYFSLSLFLPSSSLLVLPSLLLFTPFTGLSLVLFSLCLSFIFGWIFSLRCLYEGINNSRHQKKVTNTLTYSHSFPFSFRRD
ncbi:hypothetical protein ES332_A08G095700v1 [Gossypium tomentosum]|uniref:Uncharacterized protein n=1 Tax=Gossypium tomentosum TaxID=34277 RepID=A0A5D2PF70_GOSTO|nr:hypothetical protein ES332_A08G095700v1 [Gossypium tomentosum]